MESSNFFGRQFSMWHSTKLFSSIFDLGPLTPKIYSPKFFMTRLWWQLGQSVHTKTCGAHLVAMATTFGLGAEMQSPTGLSVCLLIAPSLGVYYFLSLTLSVCPSVCLSVTLLLQIDSSFLFLDGIEPFFWPSSLHVALYKTFFDFWFRPPIAQNLIPKICNCTNRL